MKLLIVTLLLLLAAIYVGNVALDDPGFIIIGYQGQVLRTSFIFFALMVILAGVLLYFAVRLLANAWATPKKVSHWNTDRKERKAQKSLSKGYAALAEGKWESAEKSLSHDASTSPGLAYIHYLGAAQAAQSQGKLDKRDDYLQLAHSSAPQADLAVGITRAELQLKEGQTQLARLTLEELQATHQYNPRILQLLAEIYETEADWDALQAMLKRLKKSKAVSKDRLDELERISWTGKLENAAGDAESLKQTWSAMPKALREDTDLNFLYIKQLVATNEPSSASSLIEKQLNKEWDARLVSLYAESDSGNPAKQLNTAENWLPLHQEDHSLLTTLGTLAQKNELWGKAKHYFETAIQFGADHHVYRQLADTLEQMGETDAAAECCKQGLHAATEPSTAMVLVKPEEG